jgi:hypothetical protein
MLIDKSYFDYDFKPYFDKSKARRTVEETKLDDGKLFNALRRLGWNGSTYEDAAEDIQNKIMNKK